MVVALVVVTAGAFVPEAGVFAFVVPFGREPAAVVPAALLTSVSEASCVGSVIGDSSVDAVEMVLSSGADTSGSFGFHAARASVIAEASQSANQRDMDLRVNILL